MCVDHSISLRLVPPSMYLCVNLSPKSLGTQSVFYCTKRLSMDLLSQTFEQISAEPFGDGHNVEYRDR